MTRRLRAQAFSGAATVRASTRVSENWIVCKSRPLPICILLLAAKLKERATPAPTLPRRDDCSSQPRVPLRWTGTYQTLASRVGQR